MPPALSISPVFPVADLDDAVAFWSTLLDIEPTFVDGDRWAQFDLDGKRLALAGSDRGSDRPGLMVKVEDLGAARKRLFAAGLEVGPIEEGPHEHRATGTAPGGWAVVLYAPKG